MGNRRNVVKDMTQGKPFRLILFFSLPLMPGNVFQQLYTFVDALIVGQKIGPYAMAALGATEWITFIVFGVVQGVTQGCSVIVSKYFGNQKQELLEKSIFNMYFISGVLAICFTVIGQIVIYPGLLLLNTPVEILDFAHLYLKILYADIPVTVLYNMLAAIMRVSCALLLTKQIGYYGIFWGELCAWIGADVFLIFIFCFLIKKK